MNDDKRTESARNWLAAYRRFIEEAAAAYRAFAAHPDVRRVTEIVNAE